MCGIVGIVGKRDVNTQLYDALTVLQHRGQDAAGIVTCQEGKLAQQKANGLVRDVFRTRHMQRLVGNVGIGHVRYPTAGNSGPALAQPFYVNSPYGIALAHNGNLTNADQLSEELFKTDLRHVNTDSDSEVLRSEEHTSELQSRPHLVCRLLLEKKNKKKTYLHSFKGLNLVLPVLVKEVLLLLNTVYYIFFKFVF